MARAGIFNPLRTRVISPAMPSTFVHALLPASCLLVTQTGKNQWSRKDLAKMMVIAIIAGNLPDLDILPGLLWSGHLLDTHRAWGHNIFSLSLGIAFTAWMFKRAGIFNNKNQRWLISAYLVGSHLFLDCVGHFNVVEYEPTVPLLWPISSQGFSLPFRIFSTMEVMTPHGLVIPVTSMEFWRQLVIRELIPSLLLFAGWIFAVQVSRFLGSRRLTESSAESERSIPR